MESVSTTVSDGKKPSIMSHICAFLRSILSAILFFPFNVCWGGGNPEVEKARVYLKLDQDGDGQLTQKELEEGVKLWSSERLGTIEGRMDLANKVPASCALNFDRVSRAVLSSLYGLSLNGKKNFIRVEPGIFGRARAAHAIIEAQARGSLHLHLLLWLLFGPIFFARFVHDAVGRETLAKFIDAIVIASLDEAEHAKRSHGAHEHQQLLQGEHRALRHIVALD